MKQISDDLYNRLLEYLQSQPPSVKRRDLLDQAHGYKPSKESYLLFSPFTNDISDAEKVAKIAGVKDALLTISASKEVLCAVKLGVNQIMLVFDSGKSRKEIEDAVRLVLHDAPRIIIPIGMPIISASIFTQDSITKLHRMILDNS